MSGPKYTDYEIERQRLLILAAELEAEIEKKKREQIIASINECKNNIKALISRISVDRFESVLKDAKNNNCSQNLIHECAVLLNEFKKASKLVYSTSGTSDDLSNTLSLLTSQNTKLKNVISRLNNAFKILNENYNIVVQEKREKDFVNAEWEPYQKISSVSQSVYSEYLTILDKLSSYDDYEKEKMIYDNILSNHSFDDEYKLNQMRLHFESYIITKQASENASKVLSVRNEFVVLSKMLYGECVSIPSDTETLENDVKNMREALNAQKAATYVTECVETVMKDLGYSLCGSEFLDKQKISKQHYNFSDNSVVTVASSETGAMMLEIVGKLGENSEKCLPSVIKHDMERFCPDYQKIKAELLKYGIKLNDKKLCPPDEKYVRFCDIERKADRRIKVQQRKKMEINE